MCRYCDGKTEDDCKSWEIWDGKNVDIQFCPMCGTSLGEVKPLTVEQLRECEGKPVWVQFFSKNFKGGKLECWAIADTRFDAMEVCENNLKFQYYGKSWVAYCREPKEDM